MPAYRVHSAKDLGYVRLAGRMLYLGRARTEESYQRYRRVVAEWLATGRAPAGRTEPAGVSVTVGSVADAYLRWARTYYVDAAGRPSTGLGPVEAACRPLCQLYGSAPATTFGPVALRAVREAMLAAGLCRNVVNQRVACVKRVFRWAVAEELVPPGLLTALAAVEPLRRGRSGARETQPVRPADDADVEAVLPFLPPTLAAMVRLQRLTGMRSGELCAMRARDVDRSAGAWLYRPPAHKTAYRGHGRVVPLGPRAQAVLGPLLRPDRPDAPVFSPAAALAERAAARRGSTPTEVVAGGRGDATGGRGYTPRSYRRAIAYAFRAALRAGATSEDRWWHPHRLRHRHATAVRQARGLDAARVLLGHRTLAQTLEYAEADPRQAAALALDLG